MGTRLTVIVDNVAVGDWTGEWGLSILAEHRGKRILVDTGASDLFQKNMERLGLSLAEVDYGVLSHAHFDHANGMPCFFRENQTADFYMQEAAEENCYKKPQVFYQYIGIPRHVLRDYAHRIRRVSGKYLLTDGAWLLGHTTPGLAAAGKRERMYRRTGLWWRPDDFAHEQSLVLESDKGLVIINSCSHGGAANIIREVREAFPHQSVYGLVGGFHLFNKTDEEVRRLALELTQAGTAFLCTGHCTKQRAYDILHQELGERLHQLQVGLVMEF